MTDIKWKKYILAFCITVTIFALAFLVNSFFYNKRIAEIKTIENRISLNFLALEIESDLLSEVACEEAYSSLATEDLGALGSRLAYLEGSGANEEAIRDLKIQYSLFELKDYLFLKQFKARCGADLHFIFFFYSNEGDCDDCKKQGYVLEKVRQEHSSVRVYSFDYNLDVPGVNSLKRFYDLRRELPLIIADRRVLYGFADEDTLLKLFGFLGDETQ